MTPNRTADAGSRRPQVGGLPPRNAALAGRSAYSLAIAAASALPAFAGCSNGSADQQMSPIAVAMTMQCAPPPCTSEPPAVYSDGNLTLYQASVSVALPVKRPSASDLKALGASPPYPHTPYLLASDESVEVEYVITNADDVAHAVWLLIDPWNEFVRYRPGVTVVNDDVTVPNLGYDLAFVVSPKSRVQGTLTPDDLKEIAIKLAAAENLLATSPSAASSMDNSLSVTVLANHLLDPENRSSAPDPLFTPWIPPAIAGVTGFDLGVRTSEPANVAIEVVVSIQDLSGNRFVAADSSDAKLGPPSATISPPSARF